MFSWLVGRNHILTWDQIQKRGFQGPPRCSLCKQDIETQEHILNSLGFNLWTIWKERNRRVFQGKTISPEELWKRTQSLIRETILVEVWDQEDWKTNAEENRILRRLNLEHGMVHPQQQKSQCIQIQSPVVFISPQDGFIKLNFNGASKGNSGPAGYGGIFRDSQGQIRWIYADKGGIMSNNEAEFSAAYQGIRIAIRNGYMKLEIEGDSNLVIETIRKLNNGEAWEQVLKSWRTAGLIQDLAETIKRIEYKVIHHVRREGNRAADFLANWGCNEPDGTMDSIWPTQLLGTRWENLNIITK
eukprot:PITA_03542